MMDIAKLEAKSKREKLEKQMAFQIKAAKLPEPEREYMFHGERKWRFDFAYPDIKIAIECEGGTWMKKAGRHNRGKGFRDDCEKYNAAAALGWLVLRFTSDMIATGHAINTIEQVLTAQADTDGWLQGD